MNIVVVGCYPTRYALGYYFDWREAFEGLRPRHGVTVIDTWCPFEQPRGLTDLLPLGWFFDDRQLRAVYQGTLPCDLLVFAPSFFYYNAGRRRRAIERISESGRRPPTVFFIENEYRRLAEKVAFARGVGATTIVSQFPEESARQFYGQRFEGRILSLPPALNPTAFYPGPPARERPIDVGTRSHRYPPGAIGDRRNALVEAFAGPAPGLRADVSFDVRRRFDRDSWAAFLRRCRGTIASEAAGVRRWNDDEPGSPLGIVSSRHFEAIGSRTLLLMQPGAFGGLLAAGDHYVALPEEPGEALRVARDVLTDPDRVDLLTRRALDLLGDEHVYSRRVERLLSEAL